MYKAIVIIITLLGIFLYSVSSILTPFVIALILGYVLAPLVDKLQSYRIPRVHGAFIVLIGLFTLITLFSLTIIPLFYNQITILANLALENKAALNLKLTNFIHSTDPALMTKLQGYIGDLSGTILQGLNIIASKLLYSGAATINIITLVFISPVVLYYVLIDWKKIGKATQSLVPNNLLPQYIQIKKDIDLTLAGYIRGQIMVCGVMGLYYCVCLFIIGVNSYLALGIISGLVTFIPYAGVMFSLLLSLIVTIIQFANLKYVLMVLGVYLLGQFIEGNIVVPKLIGDKINLHPVWIIFGLLSGGALMGFTGVLLSLPATAMISVCLKYAVGYYLKFKN